jgi:hypothetical protein
MPLSVARITDLGMATAALGIFASVHVAINMLRFDPFAAAPRRTVDAVPCRELGILLVPLLLEARVEQPFDVLQGYVVRRAASGRHVLRIPHRQPKALLQAGVAHPMTAFQLRCLVRGYMIFHAYDALNPWYVS